MRVMTSPYPLRFSAGLMGRLNMGAPPSKKQWDEPEPPKGFWARFQKETPEAKATRKFGVDGGIVRKMLDLIKETNQPGGGNAIRFMDANSGHPVAIAKKSGSSLDVTVIRKGYLYSIGSSNRLDSIAKVGKNGRRTITDFSLFGGDNKTIQKFMKGLLNGLVNKTLSVKQA